MSSLVLDGSTALSFLIRDERSPYSFRALDAIAQAGQTYIPAHWWLEVLNALLMAERRSRSTPADTEEALRLAQSLPLTADGEATSPHNSPVLTLARQYSLTIYDAAYLELAIRRGSTLATTDRALARAAKAAGVQLLA